MAQARADDLLVVNRGGKDYQATVRQSMVPISEYPEIPGEPGVWEHGLIRWWHIIVTDNGSCSVHMDDYGMTYPCFRVYKPDENREITGDEFTNMVGHYHDDGTYGYFYGSYLGATPEDYWWVDLPVGEYIVGFDEANNGKRFDFRRSKGDFEIGPLTDTSKEVDFNNMFYGLTEWNNKGKPLPKGFDISNAGADGLQLLFRNCFKFNVPVPHLKPGPNVKNLFYMFGLCREFNQSLDHWDVSNIESFERCFMECKAYNQPMPSWSTDSMKVVKAMFMRAESFNQPVNHFNVSQVTDFEKCFMEAKVFNQPLDQWDVTACTHMCDMFRETESFNQDLGMWNMTGTYAIGGMFYDATAFNPVGHTMDSWDVSGIRFWKGPDYQGAAWLRGCPFNQPLNFDMSEVKTMESMFHSAEGFNQPIGHWNVSKVLTFENCFAFNKAFNQDLSGWKLYEGKNPGVYDDKKDMVNLRYMFRDAEAYTNDSKPLTWDVENVRSMTAMFSSTVSDKRGVFNADIGSWNVYNAQNRDIGDFEAIDQMFYCNEHFNQDLSEWCVPNYSEKGAEDFSVVTGCKSWESKNRPVWRTCPRGEDNP